VAGFFEGGQKGWQGKLILSKIWPQNIAYLAKLCSQLEASTAS
jgi:hypothetical protein